MRRKTKDNETELPWLGLESVMHQAWGNLLFDFKGLTTTDGKAISLLKAGSLNPDQGPDFRDGKFLLEGLEFHGDIELHLDSKDWFRHGHDKDKAYDNVVLHVVMDDAPCHAIRSDGSLIPTLSLQGRVPEPHACLARQRVSATSTLPCQAAAMRMPPVAVRSLLNGCGQDRARSKLAKAREALTLAGGDWEEAFWTELAAAIGGPVNGAAFRELAKRLPYRVLRRYAHRGMQCEALLFGAAGLLENPAWDDYQLSLSSEWRFLASKHGLAHQFALLKQHRMRPASFPALRLSQAAGLISAFPNFSILFGMQGLSELRRADILASSYWRRNSGFGTSCIVKEKHLGLSAKSALGINVLLPFGAMYMEAHGLGDALETYCRWLAELPPECNKVTRRYVPAGWQPLNALESQGMLHLDKHGCSAFGCLNCPVWTGRDLFRAKETAVPE